MGRPALNEDKQVEQKEQKKSSNKYCGGLWVRKSEKGNQILSFIVKSDEDKQKILDHLQASIESGESFTLRGIENSYKKTHSQPNYVFMIPDPKEDDKKPEGTL